MTRSENIGCYLLYILLTILTVMSVSIATNVTMSMCRQITEIPVFEKCMKASDGVGIVVMLGTWGAIALALDIGVFLPDIIRNKLCGNRHP